MPRDAGSGAAMPPEGTKKFWTLPIVATPPFPAVSMDLTLTVMEVTGEGEEVIEREELGAVAESADAGSGATNIGEGDVVEAGRVAAGGGAGISIVSPTLASAEELAAGGALPHRR